MRGKAICLVFSAIKVVFLLSLQPFRLIALKLILKGYVFLLQLGENTYFAGPMHKLLQIISKILSILSYRPIAKHLTLSIALLALALGGLMK